MSAVSVWLSLLVTNSVRIFASKDFPLASKKLKVVSGSVFTPTIGTSWKKVPLSPAASARTTQIVFRYNRRPCRRRAALFPVLPAHRSKDISRAREFFPYPPWGEALRPRTFFPSFAPTFSPAPLLGLLSQTRTRTRVTPSIKPPSMSSCHLLGQ